MTTAVALQTAAGFRGSKMRLFLDANIITYIAFFEPFLTEGRAEFPSCLASWTSLQGAPLDAPLRREIVALRILYLLDEQAHFDWLCSDRGIAEIERIRGTVKLSLHLSVLARLLEHRQDVYEVGMERPERDAIASRQRVLFPNLSHRMHSDAAQFCEAELMDAYFFVTNDREFSRVAAATGSDLISCCPSELPFVAEQLARGVVDDWL